MIAAYGDLCNICVNIGAEPTGAAGPFHSSPLSFITFTWRISVWAGCDRAE